MGQSPAIFKDIKGIGYIYIKWGIYNTRRYRGGLWIRESGDSIFSTTGITTARFFISRMCSCPAQKVDRRSCRRRQRQRYPLRNHHQKSLKKNPRRSKRVTFAKKQRRKNKNEATKDDYLIIYGILFSVEVSFAATRQWLCRVLEDMREEWCKKLEMNSVENSNQTQIRLAVGQRWTCK